MCANYFPFSFYIFKQPVVSQRTANAADLNYNIYEYTFQATRLWEFTVYKNY